MADIAVELVSVERMFWSGRASIVTAQTTEGEIGVLPGHEPMLGQLREDGVVTIRPVDGEPRVAAVQGGFLSVSPDKVIVLADYAKWADEVDRSDAESRVANESGADRDLAIAELMAVRRMESV